MRWVINNSVITPTKVSIYVIIDSHQVPYNTLLIHNHVTRALAPDVVALIDFNSGESQECSSRTGTSAIPELYSSEPRARGFRTFHTGLQPATYIFKRSKHNMSLFLVSFGSF
jgi:hypothetical protein